MSNIYTRSRTTNPVENLMENIETQVIGTSLISKGITKISLEEYRTGDKLLELENACTNLGSTLEEMGTKGGFNFTDAQVDAGTAAAIAAENWQLSMRGEPKIKSQSVEKNTTVIDSLGNNEVVKKRFLAAEAYDERSNRNAAVFAIAYNMQAARQDEFGETFFPTIVLTSDLTGLQITVDLMQVFSGISRKTSGDITDFKKRNIIRAVADSTILHDSETRMIPVSRTSNINKLVPTAIIAHYNSKLDDQVIKTAPYKPGVEFDILGITSTDELISSGSLNQRDSVDTAIKLEYIYLTFSKAVAETSVAGNTIAAHTLYDIVKIPTKDLALATFNYNPQGDHRNMGLNFKTNSILLNKDTKNIDGTDLGVINAVKDSDFIVRLKVEITGDVNIETGLTKLNINTFEVEDIMDNTGASLASTVTGVSALTTLINGDKSKVEGYDLLAYRTNLNRRQNGQFIDVTKYHQIYNVNLLSPISVVAPIDETNSSNASAVHALITATRVRTCNAAVGALLSSVESLKNHIDVRDVTGESPDILGVGRFYVRPCFYETTIDLKTTINSLSSKDRAADIQAALINVIRDYAYRMYSTSEYKAAADALSGGIGKTPTIILGTDTVISRYLTVPGDLRTLSGDLAIRVVSTLDKRMEGKIIMSFGAFDESRNSQPNPLNFGNLIWSPELVLTANVSKGNEVNKETIVQPRFLFISNLPIMASIDVTNIPKVVKSVPIQTQVVTL